MLQVLSAEVKGDKVHLQVEASKGGKAESLEADVVLVSIGRRPFTEGLGLKEVGVEMTERSQVKVRVCCVDLCVWRSAQQCVHACGCVDTCCLLCHVSCVCMSCAGAHTLHTIQAQVDSHFRTTVPSIYAIGDAIPGPMLAHKAEEDGVAAVEIMAGGFD